MVDKVRNFEISSVFGGESLICFDLVLSFKAEVMVDLKVYVINRDSCGSWLGTALLLKLLRL